MKCLYLIYKKCNIIFEITKWTLKGKDNYLIYQAVSNTLFYVFLCNRNKYLYVINNYDAR